MMTLTAIAKDYSQSMDRIKNEKELADLLKSLSKLEVLVGVPEEKSARKDGDVTNAQLVMYHTKGVRSSSMKQEMGSTETGEKYNAAYDLYIASHGSPLWKIPPRPIIEPALEESETAKRIQEGLMKVAQALLDKKPSVAKREMKLLGQDAVRAVQNWFEDPRNGWEPDADATVQAKINKKTKSKKKRSLKMEAYKAGAGNMNQVLVDTGEMKKAITFVVREAGQDV